jgi:hypothetical protein
MISMQVDAGTTATQTRSLALDFAGASGAIQWTATSSAPWLTVSPTSGSSVPATLTLSANPTGLAADEAHTATITLAATPAVGAPHTVVVPVTLSIGNSFNGAAAQEDAGLKMYLPVISK